jgi:hypothetical protein
MELERFHWWMNLMFRSRTLNQVILIPMSSCPTLSSQSWRSRRSPQIRSQKLKVNMNVFWILSSVSGVQASTVPGMEVQASEEQVMVDAGLQALARVVQVTAEAGSEARATGVQASTVPGKEVQASEEQVMVDAGSAALATGVRVTAAPRLEAQYTGDILHHQEAGCSLAEVNYSARSEQRVEVAQPYVDLPRSEGKEVENTEMSH